MQTSGGVLILKTVVLVSRQSHDQKNVILVLSHGLGIGLNTVVWFPCMVLVLSLWSWSNAFGLEQLFSIASGIFVVRLLGLPVIFVHQIYLKFFEFNKFSICKMLQAPTGSLNDVITYFYTLIQFRINQDPMASL